MGLVRGWNYPVSQETIIGNRIPCPRQPMLVVTVAALAYAVRRLAPEGTPVIVIDADELGKLPEGVYPLHAPVRPAKLRALLSQIQRTLAKSIP
jgi:hypothetical protein